MEKSLFSGFIDRPCFILEVNVYNDESPIDYKVFTAVTFMEIQSIQSLVFEYCIRFNRTCKFNLSFDPKNADK